MINTATDVLRTSYQVVRDYNPAAHPITLWLMPIASHFCAPLDGDSTPKYWIKLVVGSAAYASLTVVSQCEFVFKISTIVCGVIFLPQVVAAVASAFFLCLYFVEGHSASESCRRLGWHAIASSWFVTVRCFFSTFDRAKQRPMETKLFRHTVVEANTSLATDLAFLSSAFIPRKCITYCARNKLFDVFRNLETAYPRAFSGYIWGLLLFDVPSSATKSQVTKAYRNYLLLHHPDKREQKAGELRRRYGRVPSRRELTNWSAAASNYKGEIFQTKRW